MDNSHENEQTGPLSVTDEYLKYRDPPGKLSLIKTYPLIFPQIVPAENSSDLLRYRNGRPLVKDIFLGYPCPLTEGCR
jgi:hypothetical protein